MKRVAIGELYFQSRNDTTDQLTKNPATERLRGSFLFTSNCKGLREVVGTVGTRRERVANRRERGLWRLGASHVENSLTLWPKTSIQLTTRLPSYPEDNRFIKEPGCGSGCAGLIGRGDCR